MSAARTDVRFLLPSPAADATVMPGADGWQAQLEAVGVRPATAREPSLVVAPVSAAGEALATGAPSIVLDGDGGARALRRAGYRVRRWLTLPWARSPALLMPLGSPRATGYGMASFLVPTHRAAAARHAVARPLLARGVRPPGRDVLTVATREQGPPYLVAAAAAFGVAGDGDVVLTTGGADALARGVLHVLPRGADRPRWAIKFARVPDVRGAFDRDERGLALAAAAGGPVAARAPRLEGRLEIDGLEASVETAATGQRLLSLLGSWRDAATKQAAVDGVADWILAVARHTRGRPEELDAERRRLEEDVLPRWLDHGARPGMAADLPALAPVLQHNDLGPWNLTVDGTGFCVVDWESARPRGLPLWDLLYFLAYAAIALDAVPAAGQPAYVAELFAGAAPRSAWALSWVRRAADELAVPTEAVGPIATLCWLHHGLSHVERSEAVATITGGPPPPGDRMLRALAVHWLGDPRLGPGWRPPWS